MTILTKPSEEKKGDKILLPLPFFPGQGLPSAPVDGHLLEVSPLKWKLVENSLGEFIQDKY